MTASRFSQRTIALALLGAAMFVSVVGLLWIGRDQSFWGDDFEYASRLATQPLGHTLLHTPPNKYLIAVPLLLYRTLFEVFGLESYFPYRVVAVVLVIVCAGLFYALVRRRVGYLLALPPTVLLLFLGSGWEELLTSMRLPSLLAIACGLGALLALERRELRWDLVAAALLCVAVASHPTGIAFTAAVAVVVLLAPAPRRWRSAWVFLAPVAVFGAWYLFWRAPTVETGFPTTASDVFLFLRQSWVLVCATVTGLFGVVSEPAYRDPIAQVFGGLVFAALVVVAALRFRRLPPTFWAALLGLVVLITSTRLSPGGFLRRPEEPRYLFPEVVLFILMLAALASPFKLPRWAPWAATAVIALGVWANFDRLIEGGDIGRRHSEVRAGQLSAYRIGDSRVDPNYSPSPLLASTARLDLAAMERFGSPAPSPDELVDAPVLTRRSADTALVGSLGIELESAARRVAHPGPQPRIQRVFGGRAKARDGCVAVSPPASPDATEGEAAVPQLAELALPPAGVEVSSSDLSRARLVLGRFAPPLVPLTIPDGDVATLRTPLGESDVPWRLTVASDRPVSVCGLPGS